MAGTDAEVVSVARELERRDAEIARTLAALEDVSGRAGTVRTEAAALRSALERLPGALTELERRTRSALAGAETARTELARADERLEALRRARRRKQDELDRAEREATTARQLLADAESEVTRLRDQTADLRSSEPTLRNDARALVRDAEEIATELAGLPRISEGEDLRPGETLEELEQWGILVRSSLLVAHGTLEAERDRLVVEANELAALVLGESVGGSSVTRVRRRLEEAVSSL